MNELLPLAAPALVLALAPLLCFLHVRLGRRLDALEKRLEGNATARATVLGEELLAQRKINETLLAEFARLGREVERLGADVVNRELYRGDKPRHNDAIDTIRRGGDVHTLVREHGLPLEEAELLMSLYADAAPAARAGSREGAL